MSPALPRPKPRPRATLEQRLVGLAIALFVLVVIPVFATWIIVCQPSLERNQPSEITVDPARLEAHVRLLSESMIPRDFAHRENLDKIADHLESERRSDVPPDLSRGRAFRVS